jgi:uncharacterized linocin/CFP29 family protein
MPNDPQVPWTDEQWARVNQVIQEEASRARVAATFLPLYGPLPPDTDFVRDETIRYGTTAADAHIEIDDTTTIRLATLQVRVFLRGAQVADPNMASALQTFRRAANILARLEDAVVFRGQADAGKGPAVGAPPLGRWQILGGYKSDGLLGSGPAMVQALNNGPSLVKGVSQSIGDLEGMGHFGPFAVVLGKELFRAAQTPGKKSLVLPQDRIIPFLGGGSLLRSTTLPKNRGVVVALGGAPVELVIATDVSLNFLQVTTDPIFVFRVFEKIVLRIKEKAAIIQLGPEKPPESGDDPEEPAEAEDGPEEPAEAGDGPEESAEAGDGPEESAEAGGGPDGSAEAGGDPKKPAK